MENCNAGMVNWVLKWILHINLHLSKLTSEYIIQIDICVHREATSRKANIQSTVSLPLLFPTHRECEVQGVRQFHLLSLFSKSSMYSILNFKLVHDGHLSLQIKSIGESSVKASVTPFSICN